MSKFKVEIDKNACQGFGACVELCPQFRHGETHLGWVFSVIVNKISVMVGGEAGAGITRSGFLFAKACLRGGLNVFGTNDYQSLIRGGHNFYIARADAEEIFLSQADIIDLLLSIIRSKVLPSLT